MFYNLARLYFILLAILKLFRSHDARIALHFARRQKLKQLQNISII